MADRKSSKPKKPKTARWQRIAMMDKEILDVGVLPPSWASCGEVLSGKKPA